MASLRRLVLVRVLKKEKRVGLAQGAKVHAENPFGNDASGHRVPLKVASGGKGQRAEREGGPQARQEYRSGFLWCLTITLGGRGGRNEKRKRRA